MFGRGRRTAIAVVVAVAVAVVVLGGCGDDDPASSADRTGSGTGGASASGPEADDETTTTKPDRDSDSDSDAGTTTSTATDGAAVDDSPNPGGVQPTDDGSSPTSTPPTIRDDPAAQGVVGDELVGSSSERTRVHGVELGVTDEEGTTFGVVADVEVCAGDATAVPVEVAAGRFELETSAGREPLAVNSPTPAFGVATLTAAGECHRGTVAFDPAPDVTVVAVLDLVAGVRWELP